MAVKMLRTADIYDLYACEFILSRASDAETRAILESRVDEIHSMYVTAGKQRIRAEARFLGIKLEGDCFTFSDMLGQIRQVVEKQLRETPQNGDNLLDMLLSAHQTAGMDMSGISEQFRPKQPAKKKEEPGVNTEWFKGKGTSDRLINDPKWHVIAKAYVELESAKTTKAKIAAIDRLNDLQHNSFHLLIDLQTGRMLEGKSDAEISYEDARKNVGEVLDIKRNSKSPAEYLTKTSSEIQRIWRENRALLGV